MTTTLQVSRKLFTGENSYARTLRKCARFHTHTSTILACRIDIPINKKDPDMRNLSYKQG